MATTKSKKLKKILTDEELREHAIGTLQSMQRVVEEARANEAEVSKRAEKKLKKSKQKLAKAESVLAAAAPAAKAAPAAESASAKSDSATPASGTRKRHPVRKLVVIGMVGAIVALVVSEDARKIVLDALFGAEEEFEYTTSATAAGVSTNGAP